MTASNLFVQTAINLFFLVVIGFRNSSSEIVMRLRRLKSDPRLSAEDAKRARFYYGYLTWGFGIVFALVWVVVIITMIFVLHD